MSRKLLLLHFTCRSLTCEGVAVANGAVVQVSVGHPEVGDVAVPVEGRGHDAPVGRGPHSSVAAAVDPHRGLCLDRDGDGGDAAAVTPGRGVAAHAAGTDVETLLQTAPHVLLLAPVNHETGTTRKKRRNLNLDFFLFYYILPISQSLFLNV